MIPRYHDMTYSNSLALMKLGTHDIDRQRSLAIDFRIRIPEQKGSMIGFTRESEKCVCT